MIKVYDLFSLISLQQFLVNGQTRTPVKMPWLICAITETPVKTRTPKPIRCYARSFNWGIQNDLPKAAHIPEKYVTNACEW